MRDLTFFRGRVALYAILKALGIAPGDEVATQAFTCVAVPEAIMATGASPLYIDLESAGFNLDPGDLEQKVNSRTRAIVVQHTYGIPASLDPILEIARRKSIPVVEDCCHTIASEYHGQRVGTFGVASFYSFEWGKPVVVGIGGAVEVNDPELRKKLEHQYANFTFPGRGHLVRLQAQYMAHRLLYRPVFYWPLRSVYHVLASTGAAESNYNPVGQGDVAQDFSLRMAAPLRARLLRKLKDFEAQTAHRRRVVYQYQARINSGRVVKPTTPDGTDPVLVRYPLLTETKVDMLRAARQARLELADWFATPVHPLRGAELSAVNYQAGSCPNAEVRCSQVITLPTHPGVTPRFIDSVARFFSEN